MNHLNNPSETNHRWRGIGRFLAVGVLGTLVDLTLFAGLRACGITTVVANTISYSAGIINNFILHRRWTFADQEQRTLGTQFTQFTIVSLSALIINNLLVLSLAPSFDTLFNLASYGTLLAKICATAVGVIWNYFANTLWTFRSTSPELSRVTAPTRQRRWR
ncbi:MAG: GtrA family protein [Chloroflexi bacterium]|nr:GtrA family protein [Chloroflexota bacterium]